MHANDYLYGGITFLVLGVLFPIGVWFEWMRRYDILIYTTVLFGVSIAAMGLTGFYGQSGDLTYLNELAIYFTVTAVMFTVWARAVWDAKNKVGMGPALGMWRQAWVAILSVFATVLYFDEFVTPAAYNGEPTRAILVSGPIACNMSAGRYQSQVDSKPHMTRSLLMMMGAAIIFLVLSIIGDTAVKIYPVFWHASAIIMFTVIGSYMIFMNSVLETCIGQFVNYQNTYAHASFFLTGAFVSMYLGLLTLFPLVLTGFANCSKVVKVDEAFVTGTFENINDRAAPAKVKKDDNLMGV